ncbi:alpha-amylase family glycosyl hydrolase [Roseateles saccharophilus]|uniref:Glycosidase n=1 Tax=Roseateles saccharophilus TaxID=304 RepID=A0A4R3V612_ROSSA|nr:alpha-amylase family glycosyl hydrolase [Roseateles saccharophilus]MDG0835017.1 alpha-amylase [Roseateles saccharophilus]TCV00396.1 glycosidase [Roseateles saccharophilus]
MSLPQLQRRAVLGAAATLALPAMSAPPADMPHLPWTRQAVIYQVNVRQYSQAGTLAAVQADLRRLRSLGVDILWLMPWQPIGRLKRKGGLGSYYSISDYTAVNPEFGTLAHAKALVAAAHELGFKVILDWVANHTAWDHPWATAHKDWYRLDARGEIYPVTFNAGQPGEEHWDDVVALDYRSEGLRAAMIDAMKFWVREADIDGFRCDVASLVPVDFWVRARRELDAAKPLFMLAESDAVELHTSGAFDMTYSWDLADQVFKKIGKGEAGAPLLKAWLARQPAGYPASAYRMRFTSNHDFNSWHGTDAELYGDAYQALAVLTFTLPGMPLIYNGQESRLTQRLAFFEKDAIAWKNYELSGFYVQLIALKHRHKALAAGQYGAPVRLLDAPADVVAFERRQGADVVRVAVNLSKVPQVFAGRTLPAWGWVIS